MTVDLSGCWVLGQVGGSTTATSVVGSMAVSVVTHLAVGVAIPVSFGKPVVRVMTRFDANRSQA
jgi:hypothetical protein